MIDRPEFIHGDTCIYLEFFYPEIQ